MAANAARSSVAGSAAAVTLIAANPGRKGLIIHNDSGATLYIGLGTTTVTASDYTYKVLGSGTYEMPLQAASPFTGQVQGIWDSATGSARITEVT